MFQIGQDFHYQPQSLFFQFILNKRLMPEWTFLAENASEFTGYTPAILCKGLQGIKKLLRGKDFDKFKTFFLKAALNGKSWTGNLNIIDSKGNPKLLRCDITPVKNKNGETSWNGFATDITEIYRADGPMARECEMLVSIVNNSPDTIFQINRENTICFVNKPFKGREIKQMVGKNIISLFGEAEEKTKLSDALEKVLATGIEIQYEVENKTNGFIYAYLKRICPLWNNGVKEGAIIFCRDISELKETQEEVIRNRKELEHLLSNIPDVVLRFDRNMNKIFNINSRLTDGKNCVGDFLKNSSDKIEYPSDVVPKLRQKIKEVFATRKKRTMESMCRIKGEQKYVLTTIVPEINLDSKVETVLTISRDISRLKKSRKDLESKNENLSKLNFELDRFVYSASHDLRAPLSSILGLINLAKTEMDLKEIQLLHQMMEVSVKKLDEVIKDIIDYSKNARADIVPELIDFHKLIPEMVANFAYSPEAMKIKFNIDIDGNTPFYSDIKRLKMIFNNLLSNSIKYADLNKAQPFVGISVSLSPKEAKIHVKDNGIGIKPEYLGNIFNMFYRATEYSKGTGLGLFIVKEIVSKLNGQISVKSEYSFGSEFILQFPILKN